MTAPPCALGSSWLPCPAAASRLIPAWRDEKLASAGGCAANPGLPRHTGRKWPAILEVPLSHDGHHWLLLNEPITVVSASQATAVERARALAPQMARHVLSLRLDRNMLVDLYATIKLAGDPFVFELSTCCLQERVLKAVSDKVLLVIRGWDWRQRPAPRTRASREVEAKVARQVMAGKEELAFEGASYVLLLATFWEDFNQGAGRFFGVVDREVAWATLLRMSAHRAFQDRKSALAEAAELLANTDIFLRRVTSGVFLARRLIERSYVEADERPVFTPSQLQRARAKLEATRVASWASFPKIETMPEPAPRIAPVWVDRSSSGVGEAKREAEEATAKKESQEAAARRAAEETNARLAMFIDPKERRIAEHLEGLGEKVTKNPLEGTAGAGRQGDAFVNGVKTEFKTLKPGATSSTVRNVINNSIRRGGQAREVIIDARGSGLDAAAARAGIERAMGVSRGLIDRIRIIGDNYML